MPDAAGTPGGFLPHRLCGFFKRNQDSDFGFLAFYESA